MRYYLLCHYIVIPPRHLFSRSSELFSFFDQRFSAFFPDLLSLLWLRRQRFENNLEAWNRIAKQWGWKRDGIAINERWTRHGRRMNKRWTRNACGIDERLTRNRRGADFSLNEVWTRDGHWPRGRQGVFMGSTRCGWGMDKTDFPWWGMSLRGTRDALGMVQGWTRVEQGRNMDKMWMLFDKGGMD